MGACTFGTYHSGTDLKVAFYKAVEDAAWEHGHGGYTGTIAEKHGVVLRNPKVMSLKEAATFAMDDLEENDHDKWGPAWAIKVKDEKHEGFYFYGWASS